MIIITLGQDKTSLRYVIIGNNRHLRLVHYRHLEMREEGRKEGRREGRLKVLKLLS